MPTTDRRRANCLTVPKIKGEQVRRRLDVLGLRDRSLRIRPDGDRLLLPLKPDVVTKVIAKELRSRPRFAMEEFDAVRSRGEKDLVTLLANLGPSKAGLVPRSYDIIGDIAIIQLPPELADEALRIGEALLAMHKRLKAVYSKAGPVTGDYRLRQFRHIAGEQKTETTHRENGCQFKMNIETTFFNPRLGGERLRVARQVSRSETVLDMFAGVGPFSILIARQTGAKVYAIDSNPEAARYMRENVRLNHVEKQVEVMEGDAARLAEKLRTRTNRVIMNLPERAGDYIRAACRTLKPKGGILHFYSFQEGSKAVYKAEGLLSSEVNELGFSVRKTLFSKALREIGARTYQVVVDAKIAA